MNRSRRRWMAAAAAGSGLTGLAGALLWPDEGLFNPCLPPESGRWLAHPLVREALAGIDTNALWDCHAHLLPGAQVAQVHDNWASAREHPPGPWPGIVTGVQARFIANAACQSERARGPVPAFLMPLLDRLMDLPPGVRVMLLALDAYHDENGQAVAGKTHLSLSNELCAQVAQTWPDRLIWAASVHPYRADAPQRVARAKAAGARALKWIPAAQGIDPASPRCDALYRALVEQRLPLITHAGAERATPGDDELGNPLRLRRALEAGVTVIVAHCATMGEGVDLDRGSQGPRVSNFELFERLMAEPRYGSRLLGDLSAVGQMARSGPVLATLLQRGAPGGPWHSRLLYGSDYPIPALMPLYSVRRLVDQGLLAPLHLEPLRELRRHNAWLFDLVLKRSLRWQGQGFAPTVFETRRHLGGAPV